MPDPAARLRAVMGAKHAERAAAYAAPQPVTVELDPSAVLGRLFVLIHLHAAGIAARNLEAIGYLSEPVDAADVGHTRAEAIVAWLAEIDREPVRV